MTHTYRYVWEHVWRYVARGAVLGFASLGFVLLTGLPLAQAQTVSGKGLDSSTASGYGAQIAVQGMQTQLNSNTATLTSNSTRLDGVEQRLDGIDQQLSDLANQLAAVNQTLQSVQTSVNNITNNPAPTTPSFPACNNGGKPEASTNKPCAGTLYRCPFNWTTPGGGDWASFGCNGQVAGINYCKNAVYNGGVRYFQASCTPFSTIFK